MPDIPLEGGSSGHGGSVVNTERVTLQRKVDRTRSGTFLNKRGQAAAPVCWEEFAIKILSDHRLNVWHVG